jgi:hypothetical protein
VNKAIGILAEIGAYAKEIHEQSSVELACMSHHREPGEASRMSFSLTRHVGLWREDLCRITALLDELEALG